MITKTIAAGTIALMLAGAGVGAAMAQSTPSRDGARAQIRTEDAAAFTDARVAGLKAGLKLTADQEKNWPAVETALRDLAKQRAERMNARAEYRSNRREAGRDNTAARPAPDAIARMREGADAMTARAAGLKKLADASEPLYKSLDDSQKRRFGALLRMGHRAGMEHHRWQRRADNAR